MAFEDLFSCGPSGLPGLSSAVLVPLCTVGQSLGLESSEGFLTCRSGARAGKTLASEGDGGTEHPGYPPSITFQYSSFGAANLLPRQLKAPNTCGEQEREKEPDRSHVEPRLRSHSHLCLIQFAGRVWPMFKERGFETPPGWKSHRRMFECDFKPPQQSYLADHQSQGAQISDPEQGQSSPGPPRSGFSKHEREIGFYYGHAAVIQGFIITLSPT